MMFRSDTMADNGNAGYTGSGIASRKAHPIFSKQKSKDSGSEAGTGTDFCSIFVCQANLNNSDPRLRPPICCVIVGVVVVVTGVIVLTYNELPIVVKIAGIVVTSIGGIILLCSFVWLFITRQTILKHLALKSLPISVVCPKHGVIDNCASNGIISSDPIMTRGLISIQYRSCEDTLPPSARNVRAATKAVHVPQKENFLSVESTCFQLIATPSDLKQSKEKRGKSDSFSYHKTTDRNTPFEERYIADNDVQIPCGKFLPHSQSSINNNNVYTSEHTLPTAQNETSRGDAKYDWKPLSIQYGTVPGRTQDRSDRQTTRYSSLSRRNEMVHYPNQHRKFNPFSDIMEGEQTVAH